MSRKRNRRSAFRRLLADLRRSETRADALRRVRGRAARLVTGRTRPSAPKKPAHRPPTGAAASPAAAREAAREARRDRAQASLAEAIAHGETLEAAVCRAVAALTEDRDWQDLNAAWALAEGVRRLPGGATAATLGHALVLHQRGQPGRAWPVVRNLGDAVLAAHVPVEAVDAALATGTAESRRRALAVGAATASLEPGAAVDLAGRFLAFGEREAAAALVAELGRRPTAALDDRRRHAFTRIEGWLDARPPAVPTGAVPVGVIDYGTPDHVLTSGNLGDYVQTLSYLGNLARLSDVTFTGEEGLGALATELQGRVRPGLRVPGVGGAVHLVPVDRDFSSGGAIPEGTWTIALGWHMHPLFDLRYDFPYHPHVRPLFVSFHVNRLDMLTEAALAYLQARGPVGCRDWNTVFLLLGAGVDAFFTGCLTTTVDGVFPARDAAYTGSGAIGVIDLPARAAGPEALDVREYSHQSDDYRFMAVTEGVRAAIARLADYQRDLDRAVTGRLHAYLPLTSLGVPVEFRPGSPGDVRFAGLVGLLPGDARLEEMRRGIRDLVARTFETILAGADEAQVYAMWRELTRDRVAQARARFEAPAVDAPTTIDVAGAIATVRARIRRFGPHASVDRAVLTDVVLAFDSNLTHPAAVLVESLVANASGPLRLWVLGRGLPAGYPEWLAAAFPTLPITFVPCDEVTYGPAGRPRRIPLRITISTMDRLLLPGLLEDVDRVVYLDVDTLMLSDVCRLARTDLGGRPFAARDAAVTADREWQRAGRHLTEPVATDLRRLMARRDGFGHPALNAGVLVMDLSRMRRDGFMAQAFAWVEHYGLNDQDTMLAYAGTERCVLDPGWNALPVLEDVHDPRVIHWASLGKPWEPRLTFGQDRWREHAARLQARAGTPPADGDGAAAPSGPSGSLHNPLVVGPLTVALPERAERVIGHVLAEHLSYVDEAGLRTLAACVGAIEAEGIEGLIVETGTARGGSAITLAAAKSPGRGMRVYDVFGMIPPPGERDGEDVHRRYQTIVGGTSKGIGGETYYGYRDDLLAEVTESFARLGLPVADNNVELVQGLFEDTIDLHEPVALAHLDGDWYASTMTCLTRIAPLLAVGGRIVIDDYDTWSGCRVAVHEYFAGREGFRFERRGRLHVVRV